MDNTKLFYIWVFGASGYVCMFVEKVWNGWPLSPVPVASAVAGVDSKRGRQGKAKEGSPIGKAIAALLFISLTFSGNAMRV